MKRKDYHGIKGFYDLREYKMSTSDFISFWRVQLYLKHVEDRKKYFKQFCPAMWEEAKELSGKYQQSLSAFT